MDQEEFVNLSDRQFECNERNVLLVSDTKEIVKELKIILYRGEKITEMKINKLFGKDLI